MSLIYNATFDSQTRVLSLLDKAGNVISSCEVPSKELVDDITKPLTFKATQDGSTVKLTGYLSYTYFQTSTDGGNTWEDYTIGTAIALNTGDEVSFRAKNNRTSTQDLQNYFQFNMTGKIEAWHNVMSMYRTNDFATYESVVKYAFYRLFYNCTSLTKSPELPATTLAERCYYEMFNGCTSLAKAPELPATTLASECYRCMFNGCTSLAKAPALPATTLSYKCYYEIFKDCTSLTKAPELPATTLALECYDHMFVGCTSLTKAPELTATTLDNGCYSYMFDGCSSLDEVRCKIPSSLSAGHMSAIYSVSWLSGVASTGTFYTNVDADWPSGESGIPTGWTRVPEVAPAVDNIRKPLTFRATQDGSTVKLTKNGTVNGDFQTSTDGGSTWTDYTLGTYITLNTGDEVSFRAKADRTSGQDYNSYFQFMMEGKIEAWHNVMSLYRTTDFATYSHIVSHAFNSMFNRCTSLTKAPKLPVTTLAHSCYRNMFAGCTSLTEAPALSATTLDSACLRYMFDGCSSLNEVHCQMPSTISGVTRYTEYWLRGVSPTGTFYTNADANWPSGDDGIPEGWRRVNEIAKDDITKPLTFRATQDGSTVTLTKEKLNTSVEFYVSFQTSRDGGNTWADYTLDSAIRLNTGDEVSFRTLHDRTSQQALQNAYKYTRFTMTGKIEAWHNAMSLYRRDDFATYESVSSHCFYELFGGCTSLTKAPALPATRLNDSCYCTMFAGCTSLKEAPELPATSCYNNCYRNMFNGCTSLTKAPALPATSLASSCYYSMFDDCSSLNEVHCKMPSSYSAEDIPKYTGSGVYDAWLYNVPSTGTFYTNADANWPSGAGGIPEGWTRVNA